MEDKIINLGKEVIHTATLCNETGSRHFLMENIRRLSYVLKRAIESIEAKKVQPEQMYILSSSDEGRDYHAENSILAATPNREKAHQLLVEKVMDYIDSWHQGDDIEHRTKESYLEDGFVEHNQFTKEKNEPVLVEEWRLDESDTYVSFCVTRVCISS
jgi:heme oxygenase